VSKERTIVSAVMVMEIPQGDERLGRLQKQKFREHVINPNLEWTSESVDENKNLNNDI